MSDARLRRVNKEIAGTADRYFLVSFHLDPRPRPDCKNDKSSNINIDLIDNSPFHLRGSFDGPQDTPYDGGHFEVVRYTKSSSGSDERLTSQTQHRLHHRRTSSSLIRIRFNL
jgi:hypothetical protein